MHKSDKSSFLLKPDKCFVKIKQMFIFALVAANVLLKKDTINLNRRGIFFKKKSLGSCTSLCLYEIEPKPLLSFYLCSLYQLASAFIKTCSFDKPCVQKSSGVYIKVAVKYIVHSQKKEP